MSLLLGGWGLMHGIKIPQQEYVLKMQGGGLMREGGRICGTNNTKKSLKLLRMSSF